MFVCYPNVLKRLDYSNSLGPNFNPDLNTGVWRSGGVHVLRSDYPRWKFSTVSPNFDRAILNTDGNFPSVRIVPTLGVAMAR